MMQLPEANDQQKQNVENWVLGNKPLVRSESTCYTSSSDYKDYIVLAGNDDIDGLETLLDSALDFFPTLSSYVSLVVQSSLAHGETNDTQFSAHKVRLGTISFPLPMKSHSYLGT